MSKIYVVIHEIEEGRFELVRAFLDKGKADQLAAESNAGMNRETRRMFEGYEVYDVELET